LIECDETSKGAAQGCTNYDEWEAVIEDCSRPIYELVRGGGDFCMSDPVRIASEAELHHVIVWESSGSSV